MTQMPYFYYQADTATVLPPCGSTWVSEFRVYSSLLDMDGSRRAAHIRTLQDAVGDQGQEHHGPDGCDEKPSQDTAHRACPRAVPPCMRRWPAVRPEVGIVGWTRLVVPGGADLPADVRQAAAPSCSTTSTRYCQGAVVARRGLHAPRRGAPHHPEGAAGAQVHGVLWLHWQHQGRRAPRHHPQLPGERGRERGGGGRRWRWRSRRRRRRT